MTRLTALNSEEATGKTKDLFNAVQAKLGVVPNMMRTMGNSPAVLEGYLNLSGALSHGKLSSKTGELIALTVSESNSCEYCVAAHTFIGGKLLKTDAQVLHDARTGNSADAKTRHTAPEEKFCNSLQIPSAIYKPKSGRLSVMARFDFPSFKTTSKLPLRAIKNSCCFICA